MPSILNKLRSMKKHKSHKSKQQKKTDSLSTWQSTDVPSPKQPRKSINIFHSLLNNELNPSFQKPLIEQRETLSFTYRQLHQHWNETVVNTEKYAFNKVFVSDWIDNENVLFGTKDNKLMLLNSRKNRNKLTEIPLPQLVNASNNNPKHCGMHGLKYNPSTNVVATGGHNANDIAIFSISKSKPMELLQFHNDWVFGIDWLDSDILVTGGKDKKLLLWKLFSNNSMDNNSNNTYYNNNYKNSSQLMSYSDYQFYNNNMLYNNDEYINYESHEDNIQQYININKQPQSMNIESDSIRALKVHQYNKNIVTLTTNGKLSIWDATKNKKIWKNDLFHSKEAVCVDIDNERGLIVVGSQKHITLYDPRQSLNGGKSFRTLSNSVKVIDSMNDGWGVRTVSIGMDIITIGGGLGRMSFYDNRKCCYLKCFDKETNELTSNYIQTSNGYIKRDQVYEDIFVGNSLPMPSAVYTHCYNPNMSKLFVAGGPTPYGLYGSSVSILEQK